MRKSAIFLLFVAFCLTILGLSAQGGIAVPPQTARPKTEAEGKQKPEDSKQRPVAKSKVYLLHSDLLRKDATHPDAQIVTGNVRFGVSVYETKIPKDFGCRYSFHKSYSYQLL